MHPWPESWPFQICGQNCLEHEIARIWYECSGDSYITQVTPITSCVGAASYLAKYIGKIMYEFTVLESLGFGRRWAKSNNWPGAKRVRLRGTVEKQWQKHAWTAGEMNADQRKMAEERNAESYLMERVGDEKALLMERRLQNRRKKGQVERIATQLLSFE